MHIRRLFDATILISALFAASSPARAQAARSDSSASQVRTVGSSTRRVAPNIATVRLNFIAEGRTTQEAGSRLAARADTLRRALVKIGIPRDSLATASEWYWWAGRIEVVVSNGRFVQLPRPDSLGRLSYNLQDTLFRAHDAIEVRIAQLGKIGAVIDSAMAHGVSDISGIQFEANDLSSARDLAVREATDNARRQAEAIAASTGMRLGRVIAMSTYGGESSNAYGEPGGVALQSLVIRGMSANGGGTEVMPRSLPVSMTVYGRWELIPKP